MMLCMVKLFILVDGSPERPHHCAIATLCIFLQLQRLSTCRYTPSYRYEADDIMASLGRWSRER